MTNALEGLRVLDLTRVWSGPVAGRLLADLGAQVIHITGRVTLAGAIPPSELAKILAIYPDDDPGERPYNRQSMGNDFSRNKLGITLELNTPEGLDVFKKLVKISGMVLENFSPRVMPNFGLDFPALKEINPGIILCSMPGFGSTGPLRDWVSYGTNLDPASGLASLMGYPGEEAHMSGNAYPDPAAGLHAVSALLTAVFHQRRTGRGQFIDLAQSESATVLLGEAVLGYSLNGKLPERMANRHPAHAPQGCYPCRGDDNWVAIAVSSDREWAGLGKVMGNSEWFDDEKFVDQKSRWENQDELDKLISVWTAERDHIKVMDDLQAAGVPAGAVLDAAELTANEHLHARGFFWEIDHPEVGPKIYAGQPFKMSGTPLVLREPAPCLGQHNEYVLSELLGYSEEEITALKEQNVIGTEPFPDDDE
ncbi:MAG: CoA transferase [Deltaproteobacteria bacterium]|nr:CoA transferase [Deltaproteobacteria bacterium]